MRIFLKTLSLAFLSAILLSSTSYAEETGKKLVEKIPDNIVITSSVQGCDEDIKKHCDGLGANSGKVFMCLAAYEEHLSEQCKLGILEAAMKIKMGLVALDYSIRACEADADKHCLNVEAGEGRIINCIRAHEADVSAECVTALKETGLWDLPDQLQ